MELAFRRLSPLAVVPTRAHPGDAGWDLVAAESAHLAAGGGRATVSTGLAMSIPEGLAGLVLPRSGLASRHGVTCANAPGLIDSGYRGEVRVALVNLDPQSEYVVNVGDRIAQLVIIALAAVDVVCVEHLPASERGAGGFGSSGR